MRVRERVRKRNNNNNKKPKLQRSTIQKEHTFIYIFTSVRVCVFEFQARFDLSHWI